MEFFGSAWAIIVSKEAVEFGGGLGDGEGYGVAGGEEDVGLGRRRRENEFSSEGEEVAESEGERVFELREVGL